MSRRKELKYEERVDIFNNNGLCVGSFFYTDFVNFLSDINFFYNVEVIEELNNSKCCYIGRYMFCLYKKELKR